MSTLFHYQKPTSMHAPFSLSGASISQTDITCYMAPCLAILAKMWHCVLRVYWDNHLLCDNSIGTSWRGYILPYPSILILFIDASASMYNMLSGTVFSIYLDEINNQTICYLFKGLLPTHWRKKWIVYFNSRLFKYNKVREFFQ